MINLHAQRPAGQRDRTAGANDRPPSAATIVLWLSAVLLATAFVFGGASRENPLSTMAIELLGLSLLVAIVWTRAIVGARRIGWLEITLLAGVFAVPVLQLVPLPPGLWMSLPGRQEAVETFRLAGISPDWAPLTLDPEETFRCLLWLVPPATLFLAVGGLDTDARFRLAGLVLILCIASLFLGGLQITDRSGAIFGRADEGGLVLPTGFFANRNHQGIAMAAALPFAAAFAASWGSKSSHRTRAANIVFAALVALLLVGVLATRSRAAVTLAGPALIASAGLFWAAAGAGRLQPRVVLVIGAAVAALVFAAQFAISAAFERFEDLAEGDARFEIWSTTVRAASDVAPIGGGLGTFEPIYQAWESLDRMGPQFINHAHNDYIELWLETGGLGFVFATLLILYITRAALRAWSHPLDQSTILARAGCVTVFILLAHSVVDYPLRTQALACAFAFAAACLAPGRRTAPNDTRG